MNELALFAGAGGGILGGSILGWRTVCAVEIDAYCQRVLLSRQRDGFLSQFPIWDDVRTFDGKPWRGHIDVISGGFPCQDISSAGKRKGIAGPKSGLWNEFARIIGEVEPEYVLIENSPHLRTRGLVTVLQDLARLGYDAQWGVLGACHAGAPHIRKRMWIVANANDGRKRIQPEHAEMGGASAIAGNSTNSNSDAVRQQSRWIVGEKGQGQTFVREPDWWPVDCIARMDDGPTHRMDRIRATGNAQVPAVAAMAWRILADVL